MFRFAAVMRSDLDTHPDRECGHAVRPGEFHPDGVPKPTVRRVPGTARLSESFLSLSASSADPIEGRRSGPDLLPNDNPPARLSAGRRIGQAGGSGRLADWSWQSCSCAADGGPTTKDEDESERSPPAASGMPPSFAYRRSSCRATTRTITETGGASHPTLSERSRGKSVVAFWRGHHGATLWLQSAGPNR